jgi:hypothetical protein
MRTTIGAAVLALGMAAQPAFAGAGAAPPTGGAAPLQTVVAAAPAIADAVVLTPMPTSLATVAVEAVAPAYRLASVAMPAVAAASLGPAQLGDAGLRRRFTGTMMEYYPFAGLGFHLSGGTRLFARRNFVQETENSARGALAATRSIMAPIATRAGFKRFNPALTAGYTFAVSQLAQIGVEGGALMGHAFASTPGLPRHAYGYRSDNAVRPDAIANLVFGMRF